MCSKSLIYIQIGLHTDAAINYSGLFVFFAMVITSSSPIPEPIEHELYRFSVPLLSEQITQNTGN